ncbi:Hydroxyisourate hydrolase [Hordeum vulgare]|nr:Hydroxyisourate hydrolase [Hordeum vulgare]
MDFEKAYDRVNSEFIREVLIRKGFESGFVHRIMHLVSGGQTTVSINREVGNFFRNKHGLRQGDSSSPFIFNLVVYALSAMIDKAKGAGHICGVVTNLIPWGVTHLQYADDTTLLFEPDDHNIASIKLILLAFEVISGLKINFLKSEVIAIGMALPEAIRVANLLNYLDAVGGNGGTLSGWWRPWSGSALFRSLLFIDLHGFRLVLDSSRPGV